MNRQPTSEHVDAINRMFTELELAYHNQFHKAFSNDQQLMMAKQLWLNELCDLSPKQLILGTRRAVRQSPYLPTLHSIRSFCDPTPEEIGLPTTRAAYLEACRAPTPKAEQKWSHPAVYFAGRESDWHFLASNPESRTFPVFERNYQLICKRVIEGENLDIPIPKSLPETVSSPLDRKELKQLMKQLRDDLDL